MYQFVKRLFLFLLVLSPSISSAQMFSVDNERERTTRPNTLIRVGTAVATFDYTGNITDPGPSLLEIDNALLAISFETTGLSANVNIGNSITGLDDGAFLDLNIRLTNKIRLIRAQKIQGGIPIQLSTGLTTSNSDFSDERFNQTKFAGGTGLFLNVNPNRKVQILNTGIIGYGFSNSNGGLFGGTLTYVSVGSRINLINLIRGRTLSIGYDYNFKSYDIDKDLNDNDIYDYDFSGHQFTIGISL